MTSKDNYLVFIQNVITRMNSNSFTIKTMTMATVAAFSGIYATTVKGILLIIAFLSTIIYWLLDSYYLKQERQYRELYKKARNLKENSSEIYDMNASGFANGKCSMLSTMFSITILPIYGVALVLILITFFCQHGIGIMIYDKWCDFI